MKQEQILELQYIFTTQSTPDPILCLEDIIEYPQEKEKKKGSKKIITYYLN